VLSEHLDSFLDPMINTATPIALGERLYSQWDFKSILASGAVDIIQPDPSHAGGITETRKIATLAEAYDVAVALHCPLGPMRLPPPCRSTAARTTPSSRSRASVSTTTWAMTCLTT
jgi:galactonate dehydratase